MTTIVMAQGYGSRWDLRRINMAHAPEYKHLVCVGAEALIGRTVRMLVERDVGKIIVVGWQEYRPTVEPAELFIQDRPGPLLDGIAATHGFWKTNRVTVLLGDVLFSNDALDLIMDDLSQMMFYGRYRANAVTGKEASELFGFTMTRPFFVDVLKHCQWMTARGRPIKYPPKLWALNRLLGGLEHDDPRFQDELITEINDYTDDLDSPEEIRDYFPRMVFEALAEEFT